MQIFQEKLLKALEMYQNDFDNIVSSFFEDKEKYNNLISKYSWEMEDNVDKNYLLRARLSFSIIYYKNVQALNKEALKNIIIYLFNEELKDRETSKYKGIGIALESLTFLLSKYNKDNKELFEKAKKINNDCAIGYDSNVRFETDIEKLNIQYCMHYALELGFKDLYYELIDIWKSGIKKWDRINLERLRDFEIEIGNIEGELEANKNLYEIVKNDYDKNKENQALSKKYLFYLVSYLSTYTENLIRLSNYDEALNIILLNIDNIKNINNNAFYKVHAGISVVDSALKVLVNIENNEQLNLLWDFIKTAFINEHDTYSKSLYDSFFKACDKMNDLELKEKVSKEIEN
ncbi:hypothetical protein BFL38_05230 [Brachyspira hampsonii]|uniref:Uncharacterized protein n=1 Tax=Brachyspira hampsonii TaxID=1287055 RepID=A0A1E5NDA0_9SPIR|nr:hypothetical protein [Brachyspira hampsonii]OEJ14134.1 hypothetical protein BFL38_05230 [Brachyspira hampsonii]